MTYFHKSTGARVALGILIAGLIAAAFWFSLGAIVL